MQLQRIHISNFRKFTTPLTISGLTNGINILAGDNEDGKSTVLHAIRSAFFTKYSTSSTAAIQPYNSAAMPEVELDFQLRGGSYFLRKVFGRKGTAELRTPNGVFSGPDAEAKLQEICATDGSDRGKESNMWGVLWVEQGKAFDTPQVGELGRRTLSGALESELGKVLSGDNGAALVARVRELNSKWYTATGRDRVGSDFLEAEAQFKKIDTEYNDCLRTFQEYEQTLQRLQNVRERLKQHEVDRTLERANTRLNTAAKNEKEIGEKKNAFQQLLQVEKTRTLEYKTLSDEFRARRLLINELNTLEKSLTDSAKTLEETEQKHAAASKALFESQKALQQTEGEHEAAAEKAIAAEKLERIIRLHSDLQKLQASMASAREIHSHSVDKKKAAQAIKVDTVSLQKLQALDKEVSLAEARLESIATKIELAPNPGSNATLEGKNLDSNAPILITEKSVIQLGNWGQITIGPGGNDLGKIRENAAKLRNDLQALLQSLDVETLEQAATQERLKAELTTEYRGILKEAQKYAEKGFGPLEEQIKATAAQLDTLDPDQTLRAHILTPEQAQESLQKARKEREEVRKKALQLKQAVELTEATFRKINTDLEGLITQQKLWKQQLAANAANLEKVRATQSDEALDQKMTEAKIQLEKTSAERQALEDELKRMNADAIDAEIAESKRLIQSIERDIAQLNGDQRELQGSLQSFGNIGITEEIEKLKGKRELASVQLERSRRKARAIKLLWETICAAENKVKEQLSTPLLRHLEPYVAHVFNDGKLAFNSSDFSITHLQRDGMQEDYDKLSLGTREQLSVLTRLAFAQLLTESGAPAVVILDDALVYSDWERLERMQSALVKASEKFQVLVLTCRQRDYAQLSANTVILEDCFDTSRNGSLYTPRKVASVVVSEPVAAQPETTTPLPTPVVVPDAIPTVTSPTSITVVAGTSNAPAVLTTPRQPVIAMTDSQPVVPQSSNAPVVVMTDSQPVDAQPVGSTSTNPPVVVMSDIQPVVLSSTNQPVVVMTDAQPVVTSAQANPIASAPVGRTAGAGQTKKSQTAAAGSAGATQLSFLQ